MSKLETAFSKALRERSEAEREGKVTIAKAQKGVDRVTEESLQLMEASSAEVPPRSSEAGSRKDLMTKKSQIQNMAHTTMLSEEELARKRIIYPRMRDTNLLNIYRNLRTKLLSRNDSNNFTTLITSVVSGGGSSLVSANVAASFAFDKGKTSLLIEGNVHTPSLGKLFDLDNESVGLMDFLESDADSVADILHETGIPRLRLIPVGNSRESSAEHFTSDRMKAFLREVRERYPERYPIIDAPSVKDSADTRILVDLCDQVVLVIPYGRSTEDDIKSAVEAIGKDKLAGVVLNQF